MEEFNVTKSENEVANPNQEKGIATNASTEEIISDLHKAAILNQVKNDEDTNAKFIQQAKKTVDNELNTINEENKNKRQQATYNSNKEACRCYGIADAVPLWQVNLMKVGHSIWFVLYWIFATVTICPINVFMTGINAFIKKSWVSLIIALLIYLIFAVGIPLLNYYLG